MNKETDKTKTPPLDKRLKGIGQLPLEFRKTLNEKQICCVLRYVDEEKGAAGKLKLKMVYNWRVLKAQTGLTTNKIATAIGKPASRVSEYLNFKHEPSAAEFRKIEILFFKHLPAGR